MQPGRGRSRVACWRSLGAAVDMLDEKDRERAAASAWYAAKFIVDFVSWFGPIVKSVCVIREWVAVMEFECAPLSGTETYALRAPGERGRDSVPRRLLASWTCELKHVHGSVTEVWVAPQGAWLRHANGGLKPHQRCPTTLLNGTGQEPRLRFIVGYVLRPDSKRIWYLLLVGSARHDGHQHFGAPFAQLRRARLHVSAQSKYIID